jgi:hypothetical protein
VVSPLHPLHLVLQQAGRCPARLLPAGLLQPQPKALPARCIDIQKAGTSASLLFPLRRRLLLGADLSKASPDPAHSAIVNPHVIVITATSCHRLPS